MDLMELSERIEDELYRIDEAIELMQHVQKSYAVLTLLNDLKREKEREMEWIDARIAEEDRFESACMNLAFTRDLI